MGRYRGGRKQWWRKKKKGGDSNSSNNGMSESDSLLIEKYLVEYRSKAYSCLNIKSQHQHSIEERPHMIGNHAFSALTTELCKRPYIDLPESLSPKERKHIHALCCALDLYHCGAGSNTEPNESTGKKRRIAVSIFANGLNYVPDLERPHKEESFPSRKCRPWYSRACAVINRDVNDLKSADITELQNMKDSDDNPYIERIIAVEGEKKLISKYARYPEQSLRTSFRKDKISESGQQLDALYMGTLESMDLSVVPTPKQCHWMLVDTVEKLKVCVSELRFGLDYEIANPSRVPLLHELAFDLEMYNHSGGEKKTTLRTCLIQLTSNVAEKDYVIDPLASGVWDAIPAYLSSLFSDPSIVKIGHGIGGMDTQSLCRDFGILVVNAFDTYEASALLASRRKGGLGLAALCKHYGLPSWEQYSELKHQYQSSNWSKRPLDEEALEYGRYDVRCLILLRKLLMRDLVKMDMIGSRNSFEYTHTKAWDESTSGASSTRTSTCETNSAIESFADSSFSYERSTDIDPDSMASYDEFQDAVESIDDTAANDGSMDEFVDAKETPSPVKQHNQVLRASDLAPFHNLMQAIKISNKRCLSLWTGVDEEHISKHPKLLSMIQESKSGKGYGKFWTDSHHKLYIALVEWRFNVAEREGIDVHEVCSLDFLIHVAYKQPLRRFEMQRFTFFLPEILEDNNMPYYQELCELITSSEVFRLREQTPLSEIEKFEVVFYEDEKKRRRKTVLIALAGTTLVLSMVSVILIRGRRKK